MSAHTEPAGPARAASSAWPARFTILLTVVHLLLALNALLLVPLLSWINFGHSGWIAWVPQGLVAGLVPAGLYIYWHFWYAVALPPWLASLWLLRRAPRRQWQWLLLLNSAAPALYGLLRLLFWLRGIRPDSV